ncbi:MAG: GntR family transcriptional regulator [Firmicutes bacterium]|nr:GntR family transcriptional regulator [Bacillota bacterium]
MRKKVKISTPRYQKIALDVAAKIINGHFREGEKIYARSALASQYGVSAETARRALCTLADMGIVEMTQGSGAVITSYEKAVTFVNQYTDTETANDLIKEVIALLERQSEGNKLMKNHLNKLLDKTSRLKVFNPFLPFEVIISGECRFLNKTAAEINFWHHTSATIIAIKRNTEIIISPGPYATFKLGDIFYLIGEEPCQDRVNSFLYSGDSNNL